jgi:hypothetical protein
MIAHADPDDPPIITLPAPARGPRKWPHLVVTNYPVLGEIFRLLQPETLVGRGDEADVRPFHGSISRRHALLTAIGECVFVEDMGSTNGTSVNGELIRTRRVLAEGDVISLGGATTVRLCYANILDDAVRENARDGKDAVRIAATKDLCDLLRITQVRARGLRDPLSMALLRMDPIDENPATFAERARRTAAIVRDTISAACFFARPSGPELLIFARLTAAQMALQIERVRLRVGRAPALAPTEIIAAILPLPADDIVAPETILCAAGERVRHAISGEQNGVVCLPALDVNA